MDANERYLNDDYLLQNPTWHVEDSPWKAKQILKIIHRNNLSPLTIAEVGCGAGEVLHQLYLHMQPEIKFDGYEISEAAISLCNDRKKDRLNYYLADFLQQPNGRYDIAMAIDVVEHIEDYFGFLRKLKDKGTYKIFHVPLEMSVVKVLASSYLMKSRKKVGHIQYFNKDTILATLKDTGYDIMDYFYTAGSNEVKSSRNLENILLTFPRKIVSAINKDLTVRVFGGYSLMILAK